MPSVSTVSRLSSAIRTRRAARFSPTIRTLARSGAPPSQPGSGIRYTLINFCTGLFDNFSPLRGIFADQRAEFLGRAATAFAAELLEALFRGRLDDGSVHGGVQPIEDRSWQPRRRDDSAPGGDFIARNAGFDHRRDVRQAVRALR